MESKRDLQAMPRNLNLHSFSFLSIEDIAHLSKVSRELKQFTSQAELWKQKLETDLGCCSSIIRDAKNPLNNPRLLCKLLVLLKKNCQKTFEEIKNNLVWIIKLENDFDCSLSIMLEPKNPIANPQGLYTHLCQVKLHDSEFYKAAVETYHGMRLHFGNQNILLFQNMEEEIDIDYKSKNQIRQFYIFHIAKVGNLPLIQWLMFPADRLGLTKLKDANKYMFENYLCQIFTAATESANIDLIQWLRTTFRITPNDIKAFRSVAKMGNEEVMELFFNELKESKESKDSGFSLNSDDVDSLLGVAATFGRLQTAKFLMDPRREELKATPTRHTLRHALFSGNQELVEFLIHPDRGSSQLRLQDLKLKPADMKRIASVNVEMHKWLEANLKVTPDEEEIGSALNRLFV